MLHTNLVTDLPKLLQGGGSLAQLHPRFEADGVDHKVSMYVLGIAVGGHLHLMPRPSLSCKLQANLMCLLISDLLLGGKGLDILVEIDSIQLVVGGLGGQKFRKRIGSVAVEPGHIADTGFRIGGLVLSLAVPHDCLHGADVLLGFLDIGYSCQPLPPMRISSSYSRVCHWITSLKL